jgi:hypothetical protein
MTGNDRRVAIITGGSRPFTDYTAADYALLTGVNLVDGGQTAGH